MLRLSVALSLCASTALADVTPKEVWENLSGFMDRAPSLTYDVESAASEGEAFVVEGLTITQITEEEVFGGSGIQRLERVVAYPTLRFTPDGQGRVDWGLEAPVEMTTQQSFQMGEEEADVEVVTTRFIPEDVTVQSHGSTEAMTHDLEGAALLIETDEDKAPTGRLTGLSGSSTYSEGGDMSQTFSLEAAEISADDEGNEATVKLSGLNVDAQGHLVEVDSDEIADYVAAGGMLDMTATLDSLQAAVAGDDDVKISTGPTSTEFGFGKAGFRYVTDTTDLRLAVTPEGVPQPFDGTADRTRISVDFPLVEGEGSFDIGVDLLGVMPGDVVWNLLDSGGTLTREPASLSLALTGEGDATVPGQVTAMIEKVTLNRLALSALGAEVTGEGSLAKSNMGLPVGEVRLEGQGVSELLRDLGAVGALPPQQAMMAQMMLGMFSTEMPGGGLETVIEFREDGSILANGQKLR